MSMHPSGASDRPPVEKLSWVLGQVARLPGVDESRGSERRLVNLAADLREPGSFLVDVEVCDLSCEGFGISGAFELEAGAVVWLKLPGFAPMKAETIWVDEGKAGCRLATPLYQSELQLIVDSQRKAPVRNAFGPASLPAGRAA